MSEFEGMSRKEAEDQISSKYNTTGKLSNCCGEDAGQYEDQGICPSCKEHCDWVVECEKCEGKGYTNEYCLACNGSGEGCADGTRCSACKGSGNCQEQCDDCDGTGELNGDEDE